MRPSSSASATAPATRTGGAEHAAPTPFLPHGDRATPPFPLPRASPPSRWGAQPPFNPPPRWKGENVATTEVAEALAAHEALQEVTVYGVSVPGSAAPPQPPRCPPPPHHPTVPPPSSAHRSPGHEGRAGMAALVLRPGCRLDGAGLYRHVVELLPPYARPRFLRLQVTGGRGGDTGTGGDAGRGGGPAPPCRRARSAWR